MRSQCTELTTELLDGFRVLRRYVDENPLARSSLPK